MESLRRARRMSQAGFTLIELLVVIVILAILAVVVIPKVTGRIQDAKISSAASTVSTLDGELEKYKLDTGEYPTMDEGLTVLEKNASNNPKWNGPYVKNGLAKDPWGNDYNYRIPSEHDGDYDVFSSGPDGQAGSADDIGNWRVTGEEQAKQ